MLHQGHRVETANKALVQETNCVGSTSKGQDFEAKVATPTGARPQHRRPNIVRTAMQVGSTPGPKPTREKTRITGSPLGLGIQTRSHRRAVASVRAVKHCMTYWVKRRAFSRRAKKAAADVNPAGLASVTRGHFKAMAPSGHVISR